MMWGDAAVKNVPIIAIVDDDASVRRSLLRVVESAGYKAETFASAREFLGWLPHGAAGVAASLLAFAMTYTLAARFILREEYGYVMRAVLRRRAA